MKCPVCWSDKAYVRPVKSWLDALMRCLFMVPMKCHHCFHGFYVPWPLTLGKVVRPPATRKASCRPAPVLPPHEPVVPGPHGSVVVPHRRRSSAHRGVDANVDSDRADASRSE
jgi:hypothetical protein